MVRNYVRRDVDILSSDITTSSLTNKVLELVSKLVVSIPVGRFVAIGCLHEALALYIQT